MISLTVAVQHSDGYVVVWSVSAVLQCCRLQWKMTFGQTVVTPGIRIKWAAFNRRTYTKSS